MKKIAVFTGTRAEYGLLYWLMKDLEMDPVFELQLIVSGMHLSPEFGSTFQTIEDDGFKINEKIEILLSSDSSVGVAKSMGLGVLGFADAFNRLKPDLLIILGDRFEALAAAQTAMILRIPILHIHGGEITEGAYDDSIRHAITKMSFLHCTSTDAYRKRVIQLGESPERVLNVGALGLEHLIRSESLSLEALGDSLCFPLKKPFFIVTYHSATLAEENSLETFNAIISVLDLYPNHQVIITYPNADDGGRKLIKIINAYAENNTHRVLAISSLGQKRYISALKYADAVIGNSSSGVIEAPSFNVPTVNIGARQQGRLAAKSVINSKCDENSIFTAVQHAVKLKNEGFMGMDNPYGLGNSSEKIIEFIKSSELAGMKKFYDI